MVSVEGALSFGPAQGVLMMIEIAISTRDTQLNVAQVLAQLGGGKLALSLPATPEIPATVNASMGGYILAPFQ